MSEVSIYKRASDKFNPKYSEVDKVLEGIKSCKIQKQIDHIRNAADSKQKRKLKEELPSICFSGKFGERIDAGLIQHSGFAILDFDHLSDPKAEKEKFKNFPFVYSSFFSPSGDGLKVLVRIPPIKEKHEGYYYGLMKTFPSLDSTSRNVSRVCFASCDSEIYINPHATEFTEYLEQEEKKIVYPVPTNFKGTDYNKINIAAKMIREAADNSKHKVLLKASKLLGGYIISGHVDETDAIYSLESEISKRDIDDFDSAKKTIRDGIEFGKRYPIFETEEFKNYKPKTYFTTHTTTDNIFINDDLDFVATAKDTDGYIEQVRNGTFKMGLSTGFLKLDEYLRFKPANLVVVNGHDNVGKSVIMWYFATLTAVMHGWKWIIYSNENKTGGVKKKIIEFYKCKSIKNYSESELSEAKIWFDEHFTIIRNTELFTYKDMIGIGQKLNQKKQYDGFLIDPYNSLWAETNDRHEYDYKAMTEFRQFITQTGCGIYLNCHAITEALRRKYPKEHPCAGYPMPPDKADTEGGGKFSNKADDFVTIHRLVQHPNDWMFTEIHVKKVKEMETGGKHTFLESPIKLRMIPGSCGFEDENGFNPITGKVYKQSELNIETRISSPKEKKDDEVNLPF